MFKIERENISGVPRHSLWIHAAMTSIQKTINEYWHCRDLALLAIELRLSTFGHSLSTVGDRIVLADVVKSLRLRAAEMDQQAAIEADLLDSDANRAHSRAQRQLVLPHPKIMPALAFMGQSFTNPRLRLADVAEHVGLSPCYLDRLLTRHTGHAFLCHLRRLRMEQASLLMAQDVLIKTVAFEVGYCSASSFSRDFHRYYKMTPMRWRHERVHHERVPV